MGCGKSKIRNITENYIFELIAELDINEKINKLAMMLLNIEDYDKKSRVNIKAVSKNILNNINYQEELNKVNLNDEPGSST
jgi:hypothetical protein